MPAEIDPNLTLAAQALASANALIIAAGAGMGVDSGLPDFRGPDGFWKAYPPYRRLGLDFVSLANPRWFTDDPAIAWGFYGHRLALYPRHRAPSRLRDSQAMGHANAQRSFRLHVKCRQSLPPRWFRLRSPC